MLCTKWTTTRRNLRSFSIFAIALSSSSSTTSRLESYASVFLRSVLAAKRKRFVTLLLYQHKAPSKHDKTVIVYYCRHMCLTHIHSHTNGEQRAQPQTRPREREWRILLSNYFYDAYSHTLHIQTAPHTRDSAHFRYEWEWMETMDGSGAHTPTPIE